MNICWLGCQTGVPSRPLVLEHTAAIEFQGQEVNLFSVMHVGSAAGWTIEVEEQPAHGNLLLRQPRVDEELAIASFEGWIPEPSYDFFARRLAVQ